MKRIVAILLTITIMLGCGTSVFAAGNMSSWFASSTAQTMQIVEAEENLMAYDERGNTLMILYGIYEVLGETDIDLSNVEAPFSDIGTYAPYSTERKAVTWLYLKGILKGFDDGTFRPHQTITRSEFVSFLVRMLENTNSSIRISSGTKNPYNDIAGHWAYDNIIKATAMGLVQGDGTSFNPDSWITKEEVITIGLRLADKMEIDINDFADVVDEIYDIIINYPIYTNGWGEYDYSQYDYVINVDDYENIYFDGISSISSYTTSKTGIVSITKYTGYLKVTGKKEGVITINAKSKNGYQNSVKVLVVDKYGNNSDNSYTVRVNNTQKVYHPDRNTIKSFTITSGSSYISVTKYSNYLSVKGNKPGTAKIKIVDNYGIAEVVTVRVTSSSSSSYYDYYEVEVGDYENVYSTTGDNIKSYSISSGSSYITVTKYSGYLRVYGKKEGTAKIKITDTYGYSDTVTVEVIENDYYKGYAYGLTDEYDIEKGDYENIYFNHIDDIDEYKLSKTGIVTVTKYNGYLRVYAKSGGTVTITGYDDYGNSERIRINVDDDYYYYDEGYDYGVTDTVTLSNTGSKKIYFDYLDEDLDDYTLSKSGIVDVYLRDGYILVEGRQGKSGTVTITVYDWYGNSEAVKVTVYASEDYDDSEPPYRDVIYPPDYEVDISK